MNRRAARREALFQAGALIEDYVAVGAVSESGRHTASDNAKIEDEMSRIASQLFDRWYQLGGRAQDP